MSGRLAIEAKQNVAVIAVTRVLVYAFGFFAFLVLWLLWTRQIRARQPQPGERIYPQIFLVTTWWFALNLGGAVRPLLGMTPTGPIYLLLLLSAAILFPMLLARLVMQDRHRGLTRLGDYACGGLVVAAVLSGSVPTATAMLRYGFVALMLYAAGLCLYAMLRGPAVAEHRWWNAVLLLAVILIVPLGLFGDSTWWNLLLRALPLCVLFLDTYYRRRFTFFDIFVKWGSYFVIALGCLYAFFALIPRDCPSPWIYALTALPLVWAVTRLCRLTGAWLDRRWLGRRFTAVEAGKYFLAGVQGAATEEQLIARAQQALQEIFQAPARMLLDTETAEGTLMPIRPHGVIAMGPRLHQTPYFSEDLALLAQLGEIFSFLLENVRLQAKKQELALEASRSELKALRAQINPHFLFNALNAIAGLIHSNPARAEETVEKLADVFRYTLRKSESEWVTLADEIAFVRSYLDVEQARFGERLQVRIAVSDDARQIKIPAMMVQTLVENAVKHGAAQVRGVGEVEIRAERAGNQLWITVSDNGPGADESATGGYGLRNVRERLRGYYGDAAEFRLSHVAGMTTASIRMPEAV